MNPLPFAVPTAYAEGATIRTSEGRRFLPLVALSHTEPALERLCAEQMVRNGFTPAQSADRCTRF
jgi:hypothetical protein